MAPIFLHVLVGGGQGAPFNLLVIPGRFLPPAFVLRPLFMQIGIRNDGRGRRP